MTPIERAARALCSLDGNPENATMDGKSLWQDYLPEVRAVLAAIREPSEAALRAGEEIIDEYSPGTPVDLAWKAMIDAVLADNSIPKP